MHQAECLKQGKETAGEKDGEEADPKPMQMSDGPSAGVGLLNLLCPNRKMYSCLEIQVEEPGPCSQKILNSLPMVDTGKGQGRYVADQARASLLLHARQVLG